MLDTEATLKKLDQLGSEAYKAGLFRKAAQIFRQGTELARGEGRERFLVSLLFWEGASLSMGGKAE